MTSRKSFADVEKRLSAQLPPVLGNPEESQGGGKTRRRPRREGTSNLFEKVSGGTQKRSPTNGRQPSYRERKRVPKGGKNQNRKRKLDLTLILAPSSFRTILGGTTTCMWGERVSLSLLRKRARW